MKNRRQSLTNLYCFLFSLVLMLPTLAIAGETRPLIGVTPSISSNSIQLNYDYVAAINENGGLAMILPPTDDAGIIESYVKMLDGAVFTGGPDIPPDLYGQAPHPTTQIMEPRRSDFEKRFIASFLKSDKPALGICLGMQFSNVLTGGTLVQDIPSQVSKRISHRNGEMYTNFHPVGLARGSRIREILQNNSVAVISRHHQAVDQVAEFFTVVGRSPDGIIEALERRDEVFGLFVQWHPESLKDADPLQRNRLFRALVEACHAVRSARSQD